MKAKRILIAYLNNGNLQSQVAKEYLFNRIVDMLIEEGRILDHTASTPTGSSKEVKFEDGTKVWLRPFSMSSLGMRFTHVYIDGAGLLLPNGNGVKEMYMNSLVHGDYLNFDTSDKHRAFVFNYGDGQVNLVSI